jgi:hypothetical protein
MHQRPEVAPPFSRQNLATLTLDGIKGPDGQESPAFPEASPCARRGRTLLTRHNTLTSYLIPATRRRDLSHPRIVASEGSAIEGEENP